MAKNKNRIELSSLWEKDLQCIKLLLVLLANKLGVKNKEIAKAMGISESSLSKLLNPAKYKNA